MEKIVIGVLLAIIATATLYINFRTSSSVDTNITTVKQVSTNEKSSSNLQIVENNIDLWDISMKNWKTDISFYIENKWEEDVSLWIATTSCMCTVWVVIDDNGNKSSLITMHTKRSLDMVVAAWKRVQLLATFDPNAHWPNATGPIYRDLTILTNSKKSPLLKFTFQGNVVK